MRKYGKTGKLETVICNMYGKKIAVKDGIVREGAAAFDHAWDYFSEKDGEVHHFDLCESCYDELVGGFRIPVDVEEQTELLRKICRNVQEGAGKIIFLPRPLLRPCGGL